MPTYQYSCTECGHFFEQVQSFSDDALTTCPKCQGRLRKVFNAVGVVFKGSGFYRTDSRAEAAKSGKGSGSSPSSPSTSSGPSPSGSTDAGSSTKPASTSGSGGSGGTSSTSSPSGAGVG